MRHFLFYIILLTTLTGLAAQEVLEVPEINSPPAKKFDFGFQAGTSATMFGRSDAVFSSYLAPELRFHVTPKFQLNTGVIYSRQFLPATHDGMTGPAGAVSDRFLVFAEGLYHLNERISLSGMVVKDIGAGMDPRINSFYKNTGYQSMGMGVQYKVTDNLHLGARIRVSNGRSPYYFNPHYRHPLQNPSSLTRDIWW